jgi:hypothetical protein
MAKPPFPSPPHWQRVTLEPNSGSTYIVRVDSGGTPSTTREELWDGTIPWLTPKEITNKGAALFVSHTARTITPAGLAESAARLLPPETVMLTKRAPIGAVAINAVPMATNQGFLNFQCGPGLRPLFLAYWFRVHTQYLQQVANGSTYLELYQSDLFEFEIAVPPLPEQDAILGVIGALQYALLLGPPLQQAVTTSGEMLRTQEQDRRLLRIRDALVRQLVTAGQGPALAGTFGSAQEPPIQFDPVALSRKRQRPSDSL